MTEFDTGELADKIKNAWLAWAEENSRYIYSNFSVTVYKHLNGRTKYTVTLACMYEYVPVSLSLLNELSKITNCENIEESGKYSRGGCETCDYGSSYEISFDCW